MSYPYPTNEEIHASDKPKSYKKRFPLGLKPCPFCGSECVELIEQEYTKGKKCQAYLVSCYLCRASKFVASKFLVQIRVEWNRRTKKLTDAPVSSFFKGHDGNYVIAFTDSNAQTLSPETSKAIDEYIKALRP